MPSFCTTNLSRALLRFFFSPSRAKTRPMARASGSRSSSGTNSSNNFAWCETAEEFRHIVDVHEVELDVLPGGDVADVVGILPRQLGQRDHLLGVQPAVRDLDALHARRVPEGVGALGERRVGELLRLGAVV